MYHLFNYWAFLYIYSCNLGDRIQDSNVSDMKFGWLDLFASRMSSYLNVLFTRWLQVPKSSVSGTVSSCLFLWSFLSWHNFFFFYLVMKSWETFFMLNFIYFHFQIAIVKVLYEIRLLSGKSYWKYGCKWRWFVRSLTWCLCWNIANYVAAIVKEDGCNGGLLVAANNHCLMSKFGKFGSHHLLTKELEELSWMPINRGIH